MRATSTPVSLRLIPLAALALVACSGADAPIAVPDVGAETGGDGGDGDVSTGDDVVPGDADPDGDDTGSGGDAEADVDEDIDPDAPAGTLGVGELCLADRECASFLCFRFDATIEEGFCTQYCRDNTGCPDDGFECVFLANSGGDFAKVCAPDYLCIDRDGDGFGVGPSCEGPDCDDTADDIFLGADEVCDGVDNDCDGNVDENVVDANEACFTGFPGECSTGRILCQEGLTSCVADRTVSAEVCDGLDNDCDGQTDEDSAGAPLTQACYGGPAGTAGVGVCQEGVRTCAEGTISDCTGAVLPLVEVCDGLDNDCDGDTDEGFPGAGQPCDVPGALGICSRGRTQCTDEGELICVAERTATEETCDGLDNDCDGATDEDEAGAVLRRACYGGPPETREIGSCADGEQVCDGGDWTGCEGALLPVAEVCNSLDDDCDGETDEDGAAGGFVCATGLLGACARGVTSCTDLGTECTQVVAESDEICDGVDNDCDGEVDEDDAGEPLTRPCYGGPDGTAGRGICVVGVQSCGAEGFGLCQGEQRPQGEVCDGLDNDCDGDIDEGADGEPLQDICYGGPAATLEVGACRAGLRSCNDGELSDCIGAVLPFAEICDGIDNDCDGSTDEDSPGANQPCDVPGAVGVCVRGRTQCTPDGDLVCVPERTPSDEICDGLDNDCDGDTDEDAAGDPLTRVCYGGPDGTAGTGVCTAGVQVCGADGFGACEGEVRPGTEVCDGDDNDCDGSTDEGNPGGGVVCATGLDGVCGRGITVCDEGEVVCEQQTVDSEEVCDGLDNDCDGSTDEDVAGDPLTRVCYGGPAGTAGRGVCTAGVQVCGPDGFGACEGEVRPSFDLCDGLDNDCDGPADEGNPGGGIACSTGLSGVCAAGVTECADGDVTCAGFIEVGEQAEICDGLDNDCDGTVDNGFPGLGTPCFAGLGNCRRAGVTICDAADRSAPPICDAVSGTPSPVEACDYVDDDCDGTVDEGFLSGGLYATDTACGSCFTDCTSIYDRDNAYGVCALAIGVPTCRLVCDTGFFDLNGVPDDGCEFELDSGAIYVSQTETLAADAPGCGLGPSATGEGRFACATIGYGIGRAVLAGRPRVRVADGAYEEDIVVSNGVSLLGGHRALTWEFAPASTNTALRARTGSGDVRTIRASDITSATVIEGFLVYGQNATSPGANSYAFYVSNSTAALQIRNNRIFAGAGAAGSAGDGGTNGAAGVNGSGGAATRNATCSSAGTVMSDGGAGGAQSCQDPATFPAGVPDTFTSVSGGTGGAALCPALSRQEGGGASGQNGGGSGGAGGWGHSSSTSGSCTPTAGRPETGTPGGNAAAASNGTGGSACSGGVGSIAGGEWRGGGGAQGGHGAHGRGGGGGGAGSGQQLNGGNSRDIAGSGGGGGSGGCAGEGGYAGSAGGGSFGVFLYWSTPPASAAAVPVVTGNVIARNRGGAGGSGGSGGAGGDGGAGGAGGPLASYLGPIYCIFPGALGGNGSRGGHGGGGGGGCGGSSFDIVAWGINGQPQSFAASNTFTLPAGTATGGAGGAGGLSINTVTGTGSAGTTGRSGNVEIVN